MPDRLARVLAAIDAANAADPHLAPDGQPQALLYGRRMSETLARFAPQASEALRIAARGQHIERWTIPRASYPEGRIAYLTWRKDLQKHHAARCGAIMAAEGYGADEIARVGRAAAQGTAQAGPRRADPRRRDLPGLPRARGRAPSSRSTTMRRCATSSPRPRARCRPRDSLRRARSACRRGLHACSARRSPHEASAATFVMLPVAGNSGIRQACSAW